MAHKEFAFVMEDGAAMPQGAARSVIRSHCMRGVNRRTDSRRAKQMRRRRDRPEEAVEQLSPTAQNSISSMRCTSTATDARPLDVKAIAAATACSHVFVPYASFTDMDLLPGHEEICRLPRSRELVHKYGQIKTLMYPIDHCVGFKLIEPGACQWFIEDVAFINALLFTSCAIQDFAQQKPLGGEACYYLQQTLHHLGTTLSLRHDKLYGGTLYIVLTLCIIASIWNDDDALSVHIAGLKHMIELGGGADGGYLSPKFCFKLARLDLSAYMSSGEPPRIFDEAVAYDSHYGLDLILSQRKPPGFVELLKDDRLLVVFLDFRYFAAQINRGLDSRAPLTGTLAKESFISIQSRLLQLSGQLANPLDELLRLGLIAFSSNTLRIPGRTISSNYLTRLFRNALEAVDLERSGHVELSLWLLLVGAISVFRTDDAWLRNLWKETVRHDLSWNDARGQVSEIMWIKGLHDELGKEAFDSLADAAR
ncbi:hypothetical protein S40288_03289 [Stachybotrys chartarum IBT 40288]|nr:hypothetical protein S40288_03289 [Stachybotrys chartarum IBT 40288]